MGFKSSFGDDDLFSNQPIYDLRQIYAKDLLGDTLKRIKYARESRTFSLWYGLLRWDLYADLYQKFNKDEIKMVEDKIKETRSIINKYQQTFLNKNNDSREIEIVTQAIWDLEVLMKNLSEEHSIYGRKDMEDEGL